MMGTLLFLAQAHSEVEGGFGLNLDIFGTNLINLSILLGVLFYYGRGIVGNILNERRSKIAEQITEAEAKAKEAAATLAQQQQKLAQSQAEAQRIRQEAQTNAEKTKAAILAAGEKDVERLKATAMQDLNTEQDRAIAELRQRATAMALERAQSQLKGLLDDSAQQTLIDRSIAQIGGR